MVIQLKLTLCDTITSCFVTTKKRKYFLTIFHHIQQEDEKVINIFVITLYGPQYDAT